MKCVLIICWIPKIWSLFVSSYLLWKLEVKLIIIRTIKAHESTEVPNAPKLNIILKFCFFTFISQTSLRGWAQNSFFRVIYCIFSSAFALWANAELYILGPSVPFFLPFFLSLFLPFFLPPAESWKNLSILTEGLWNLVWSIPGHNH